MRNPELAAMFLIACVAFQTCSDSKRKKKIQGLLEAAEADLDAADLKDSGAWNEAPTGSVSRTADGNLDLEETDDPIELAGSPTTPPAAPAGANGPSGPPEDKPPQ